MKLSNRQIGAVGVARVTGALLRNGYSVLTPIEDYAGYDLVAEKYGKFHRIQVKTSEKQDPRRNRYGFMTSVGSNNKSIYNKSMVDYIVCWAMDADLFWIFKPGKCKSKSKKCHIKTGSSWRIISDL
jgi:PD-(D/E)XK endonuclease